VQRWLQDLVDEIADGPRVNPPSDPIEPALELQLALKAEGRENDVTEAEMRAAFTALGVPPGVDLEEALENFASWQ